MNRKKAMELAVDFLCKGEKSYEICGSIRRKVDKVKDIDVLILRKDVYWWIVHCTMWGTMLRSGEKDFDCKYKGIVFNFRSVPLKSWGAGMLFLTGSGKFNLKCRSLAKKRGLKLNRYGLYKQRCISTSEVGILDRLDLMHHIDPESRCI